MFFLNTTFISNTWQSEIVSTSSIKRSQKKNKHSKLKTCWVKIIKPTKSIPYQWKAVLTPPFYRQALVWTTHYFYKKILIHPFFDFQKSQLLFYSSGSSRLMAGVLVLVVQVSYGSQWNFGSGIHCSTLLLLPILIPRETICRVLFHVHIISLFNFRMVLN